MREAEIPFFTRHLDWEGCWNVRDLGGLPTVSGATTRFRAVVRSDDPRKLTAAGWASLQAHGIRTIVCLQTIGAERNEPDRAPRPRDLKTLSVAVEDFSDTQIMDRYAGSEIWSTPLYYRDALGRWPDRSAAAIRAIATARPGGVLVHCGVGRDRTGLVVLLLLALSGVPRDEIIADYELSYERMRAEGNVEEVETIHECLAGEHTTARESLLATLESIDVEACMRGGGLSEGHLEAARARLMG
jgi:protein tyrosine/serine phosphatase